EWGQLFAYLPEVRRMLKEHGPSVVFLPSPRLDKTKIRRASEELGKLASDLGISNRQLREQARMTIREDLEGRDELHRFGDLLD
ncbi:MAG TPA: hypothetical protein VE569_08105, partial [Acidimicrobiia bacterium]|nr:hypothetical protein [Acidimicrobiia bacterium]